MAEQSLLAIEEADVVLFMDARWLMPADSAIAKHLRSRKADLPGGEQN
jgi:GTP-binding protein